MESTPSPVFKSEWLLETYLVYPSFVQISGSEWRIRGPARDHSSDLLSDCILNAPITPTNSKDARMKWGVYCQKGLGMCLAFQKKTRFG